MIFLVLLILSMQTDLHQNFPDQRFNFNCQWLFTIWALMGYKMIQWVKKKWMHGSYSCFHDIKHSLRLFPLKVRILRKPRRDNRKIFCKSEKILRIDITCTNRFWKVCQLEKTILNPGLVHRSTDNFCENRKKFTIQESFQDPGNLRKSRKIFCHVTLAPVVGTLLRYSTLCRTKSQV